MDYVRHLVEAFKAGEDPENAIKAKQYLRGQFESFGLSAPKRRSIQKEFFKRYNEQLQKELFGTVHYLWTLPQREFQHCGVDLLVKHMKLLMPENIEDIEKLIVTKSWWDTVDGLSVWICGEYFQKYPGKIPFVTDKWMSSGNMWLQRSVLLFQLKYKEKTDTGSLAKWIQQLTQHKDFFIKKAIGWILREYSKTNPAWVVSFVNKQPLSILSKKEALKRIEGHH